MLKLMLVTLTVVLLTILAMDNMHHVQVGLIIGKQVHVRLFFLLLTSFVIGCFSVMLLNLYRGAKSKKSGTSQDIEGDDFFSE